MALKNIFLTRRKRRKTIIAFTSSIKFTGFFKLSYYYHYYCVMLTASYTYYESLTLISFYSRMQLKF